jgi:hypothetical protein
MTDHDQQLSLVALSLRGAREQARVPAEFADMQLMLMSMPRWQVHLVSEPCP